MTNTFPTRDFEEGDTSDFDLTFATGAGSAIAASAAAALYGSYGCACTVAGIAGATAYGEADPTGGFGASQQYGFYFDPNSLAMANNDEYVLHRSINIDSSALITLSHLYTVANGYRLRIACRDDNGATQNGTPFDLSDGPHWIEIQIHVASGPGYADGYVKIWVDEVLKDTISNLELKLSVDMGATFWGFISGVDATTSGTIYLDQIIYNATEGYIGPPTNDPDPAPTDLLVDWNNDGTLEANELSRIQSVRIVRGRDGLFAGDKLARMKVGECRMALDNYDRRYDPWYATSPIYPNVAPGREFLLRTMDRATGIIYNIFRGKLDSIESQRQLTDPKAVLVGNDGWRLLSDRRATIALQTNATTDALLNAVLNDIGWPAAWGSDLDVGSDTIPYAWVNDQAAYDAIHDMVESEMGYVYVGVDGKIYFQSRANVMLAGSSFTLDQAQVLAEMLVGNPWEFVKNKVSVKAFPRKLGSSTEIWRLEETRMVQPGQAVTIWGTFRDSNYVSTIAQDVVNPVATTDYTMNTQADGGGTDLTGSFTVVPSIFSGSVKLVVTNGSAFTGYITLLKVRGKPLELLSVAASISENSSSQAAYGKRELSLELVYQQQTSVAVDFSDWLVSWLATPLPTLVVELVDRPSLQFAYDLGTVITFTSAYLGLNHRFRIGKIEHDGEAPFQVWRTRWTLEPMDQVTDYWQLGITGHDELGQNTRLAY